jgi:long-subunit acyl-CoA synthetase (AMP-forming)
MVIGDHRPFLAALIIVEPPKRAADPTTFQIVAEAIERVNAAHEPRERIEAHVILRDVWTASDELTATLKPRRGRILEKYAAEIQAMYEQAASSAR